MLLRHNSLGRWCSWMVMGLFMAGIALLPACESSDDEEVSPDAGTGNVADYAGHYEGTFSGGDSGSFEADLSATGAVSGSGFSNSDGPFGLSGSVTPDGNFSAVSGNTDLDSRFSGHVNANGSLTGSWSNPGFGLNGSFSGQRQ